LDESSFLEQELGYASAIKAEEPDMYSFGYYSLLGELAGQ
jgi:hypothetical protein